MKQFSFQYRIEAEAAREEMVRQAIANGRNLPGLRRRPIRSAIRLWIDDYKASLGCARCGEDDPRCLDCHHLGVKSASISKVWRLSLWELWLELAKCEVLCANCHRKMGAHGSRRAHRPETLAGR